MAIDLTDQFDINPETVYYCSPITKCSGFTYAMRLVLSTRKYPEALDQLRELIPDCLTDTNNLGWTLLHLACRNSNTCSTIETVKLLIDNGIDVNSMSTCKHKYTPLRFAILYSDTDSSLETVKLLLQASANITSNEYNTMYLHSACSNFDKCNVETLKLLLDHGIPVNQLNNGKSSTLMQLCHFISGTKYIDAVKLLLDYGAEVNLINNDGLSALYYICENIEKPGAIVIFDMLIKAGADIDHVLAIKSYNILVYAKYLKNKD
jgi:ankyrin repeat protein